MLLWNSILNQTNMSETPGRTPNQPLSLVETARQFLEVQYGETDVFKNGVTELAPIAFEGLTTYSFMYEFPNSGTEGERVTEILAADLDNAGIPLGFGEISLVTGLDKPRIKNKPYVAYTETLEAGLHKGLNARRLKVMNELAKQYFGFPLHSDRSGDTEPEARRSWDRLVDEGYAEQYEDNETLRYRFIA